MKTHGLIHGRHSTREVENRSSDSTGYKLDTEMKQSIQNREKYQLNRQLHS